MGRINKGIPGRFSGITGTVAGDNRRGIGHLPGFSPAGNCANPLVQATETKTCMVATGGKLLPRGRKPSQNRGGVIHSPGAII